MSKATLGDILRHIGRQLAANVDQPPFPVPLEAIVKNLEGDDAPGLAEMPDAVAALRKKMTGSYIMVTMNRMKELQEVNKSVTVKFAVDDDRGVDVVIIGLKDGNGTRERSKAKTDEAQYKKGFIAGIEQAISFVPDFVEYSPDELAIAQRLLSEFRAHLSIVKDGVK